MLTLTTESRNNRHNATGEPTTLEHQLRSARTALWGTLAFLRHHL